MLRQAILNNWLVNLHGKDGEWIEMDLMQEHFNFWLEEMAQHKGKAFDEPFYQSILSANVHHFMRLKDEMEECVSLQGRRKRHSAPNLKNELQALMKHLRDNLLTSLNEVNRYRTGRDEGFSAVDDFANGFNTLKKGKLKNYIKRSCSYSDILGMQNSTEGPEDLDQDETIDEEMQDTINAPPPHTITLNGELHLVRLVRSHADAGS